MNKKIKEFVEAVKAEMGDNFVGVIDKIADSWRLRPMNPIVGLMELQSIATPLTRL